MRSPPQMEVDGAKRLCPKANLPNGRPFDSAPPWLDPLHKKNFMPAAFVHCRLSPISFWVSHFQGKYNTGRVGRGGAAHECVGSHWASEKNMRHMDPSRAGIQPLEVFVPQTLRLWLTRRRRTPIIGHGEAGRGPGGVDLSVGELGGGVAGGRGHGLSGPRGVGPRHLRGSEGGDSEHKPGSHDFPPGGG